MKNNLFMNSSPLSLVENKYSKILIGYALLAAAAFIVSSFLFVNLASAATTRGRIATWPYKGGPFVTWPYR